MMIKKFKHVDVEKDGKVKNGGSVITKGGVRSGKLNHSFGNADPRYFISIIAPLENGVVEGIKVIFDDYEEMFNLVPTQKPTVRHMQDIVKLLQQTINMQKDFILHVIAENEDLTELLMRLIKNENFLLKLREKK